MGPGEAAEARSRKRWLALLAGSLLLGGVSGILVSVATDGEPGSPDQPLPILVAVLLAAAWLVSMAYSVWYYETKVDELERNSNYFGYALGAGLLALVYPVWYLLWWAAVVPEPSHEGLMGLLLAGALAGYIWKKYR
jgi:hypothetical protein